MLTGHRSSKSCFCKGKKKKILGNSFLNGISSDDCDCLG